MRTARVGIVGPRRVRQGLGPFVARALEGAGAEVACFLSTSTGSMVAASEELQTVLRHGPRGYIELEELLGQESLDALAILSPAETHQRYLEAALESGLHVLCEKPFIWGTAGVGAATRRLVEGFAERGLLLRENCQWPYTLPAFRELHPDVHGLPERFEMRLSPASEGAARIGDAMPHVLSLLQALVPGEARLEDIRFEQGARLDIGFSYQVGQHSVAARVELVPGTGPPREAAYALDGRRAERRVEMRDYSQFFEAGTRRVAVPDPLPALVADFVADLDRALEPAPLRTSEMVEDGCGTAVGEDMGVIARRAELLEELARAYESHC